MTHVDINWLPHKQVSNCHENNYRTEQQNMWKWTELTTIQQVSSVLLCPHRFVHLSTPHRGSADGDKATSWTRGFRQKGEVGSPVPRRKSTPHGLLCWFTVTWYQNTAWLIELPHCHKRPGTSFTSSPFIGWGQRRAGLKTYPSRHTFYWPLSMNSTY